MLVPHRDEDERDAEMVKRLTVTLDDDLHAELEKLASEQERTVPNLLAYLGREAVKQWRDQQQANSTSETRPQ